MQEIELKFQIPEGMRPAVRQALAERQAATVESGHAARVSMHAAYLDTPDRSLARRRCALRVRQEGDIRVQTFKGAGADAMTRLEENRPAASCVPFDLSLHGTAVQQALRQALPGWQPDTDPAGRHGGLSVVYETRFERAQVELRLPQGRVLLCLDEGQIAAGALQQPLAELEFELLAGSPLAVIEAARQWSGLFGLWLDVQSKALKGTRLAQEAATGQPVPATVPVPDGGWLQAESGTLDENARRAWLSRLLDLCAGPGSDIAQLRPGWPLALQAWAHSLQHASRAGAPTGVLSSAWLTATRALSAQVTALSTRVEGHGLSMPPTDPLAQAARDLATHASTTRWALDLLSLIHAESRPEADLHPPG